MAVKTLIRSDRPDRWTDQIRHIDMYKTRPDNARVRALSDPCGEQGDRQVNGSVFGFSFKRGLLPRARQTSILFSKFGAS